MPRPVQLRDEEPPDNAILVVRGGLHGLTHEIVRRTTERSFEAFGFYGVSVFAAIDCSVEDLCRNVEPLSKTGRIRTARCGDVRRAGFALLATGGPPHFDILLADVSDETIHRLSMCFAPDEPNPARA